jgi:hypothetical protein
VSTSFLLFWCLISCLLSYIDVCRLYHVLWYIHSLPQWNIVILYISICFQFLLPEIFLKVVCTECLIHSCHCCIFCFSLTVSKLQPLFSSSSSSFLLHNHIIIVVVIVVVVVIIIIIITFSWMRLSGLFLFKLIWFYFNVIIPAWRTRQFHYMFQFQVHI